MTALRWLAVAGMGALGVVASFIVMQLAFAVANGENVALPGGSLLAELVGFGCFLLWLASGVAVATGLIAAFIKALS